MSEPPTAPSSPSPEGDGAPSAGPRALYDERVRRFGQAETEAATLSGRIARWRLGVFLAAFGVLVVRAFGGSGLQDPLLLAAGALGLVFLGLLWAHRRVRRQLGRAVELRRLNQEALARLDRSWDDLPVSPVPVPEPDHPYAADLDLFGRASVFQLLSPVSTAPGRRTLASWLLEPADPTEIRARQGAVNELARKLELRDELAVRGRIQKTSDDPESLNHFLAWAEARPWSLDEPWLAPGAWGLPISTLTLLGLQLWGVLPGPWWALPLGAQLLLLWRLRRISAELARASAGESGVRAWAGLLEVLAGAEFEGPRLEELRGSLTVGGVTAPEEIRRLERLLHMADVRLSFFHPLLNPVLLWDVHVQRGLDRWRRRSGAHVRGWIEAAGQMDALGALSALRFDHPDWCMPELASAEAGTRPEGPVLRARELGHPLISPATCVRNDVVVGPPGSFLLVTGSNMSGKSTLLRAVGVNVVLAQAGGPACARELRLPPVKLRTGMRVQDSLARGLSQFMAELERLRDIVMAARALDPEEGPVLLYLLDEVLQGTNTAERQIAARTILRHLLSEGAVGAVTTHDLTLADAPDLTARARAVHFTEMIQEDDGAPPRISFDYRLRPGIATSTNALALMELVGLGEEPREGDPPVGMS